MRKDDAIRTLQNHARDIRARGVVSIALFGSTLRGDARTDSDVDLLIDLPEDHSLTLVDLVDLRDYLSGILNSRADVSIRRNLKPFLKDAILAEAETVF